MGALVILPGPTIMGFRMGGMTMPYGSYRSYGKTLHQGLIIIALSHDIPIHIRPNPHFQWSPAWIPWKILIFNQKSPWKVPMTLISPAPKWQHITWRWLHIPVHDPMPRRRPTNWAVFLATCHQKNIGFPNSSISWLVVLNKIANSWRIHFCWRPYPIFWNIFFISSWSSQSFHVHWSYYPSHRHLLGQSTSMSGSWLMVPILITSPDWDCPFLISWLVSMSLTRNEPWLGWHPIFTAGAMKNTLFLHPIVLASSLNQVDPDIEIHSNPPFYKPNKQNINYIRMLMGKKSHQTSKSLNPIQLLSCAHKNIPGIWHNMTTPSLLHSRTRCDARQ